MLTITRGEGFQLTFANGYTASVQFGPMHCCSKRDWNQWDRPKGAERWESATAEIALIRPDDSFVALGEGDTVKGWVQADEVAAFLLAAATNPESLANKEG